MGSDEADKTIYIADHEPMFRIGTAAVLSGLQVVCFDNGADLLLATDSTPPSLLIVSEQTPVVGGDVICRLLAKSLRLPCILVVPSGELRQSDRDRGVHLVPRNCGPDALLELVQAKLGGGRRSPADGRPGSDRLPSKLRNLTTRELEVLNLIVRGFTYQEIADLLYLSRRTIESHRENISAKLGLSSRRQLVRATFNILVGSQYRAPSPGGT